MVIFGIRLESQIIIHYYYLFIGSHDGHERSFQFSPILSQVVMLSSDSRVITSRSARLQIKLIISKYCPIR